MKLVTATFASAVVLLLSQAASADRNCPGALADCERFRVPWERPQPQQHEPAIRPDPRRDYANPVDGSTGAPRGINRTGIIKSDGNPQMRPDPRRDTTLPVDENTGGPRSVSRTNIVKAKGNPQLRPDPLRERTVPVDETTGAPRSVNPTGVVKAQGNPRLRPDPLRDRTLPVDEKTGAPRGVSADAVRDNARLDPAAARDAKRARPLFVRPCTTDDACRD